MKHALQKYFKAIFSIYELKNKDLNKLGLDVDYCFFFLPNNPPKISLTCSSTF